MKQHRHFWRIFFLSFALFFAIPAISMMQEPMQAEAAAPKLNKKKASVNEGKTITLTVKNPTKTVTWKSSNSKVVKITKKAGSRKSKATLKGVQSGTATITAKVGSKKLTAKITVKHVHKWRGYATCTEPDKCTTCGAGRGIPLGHNWAPATCLSPSTCQRCGATQGELGAHVWDQNEICTVCNTMNIDRILDMQISNVGGNPGNWVDVDITNHTRQMLTISSTNSRLPAAATLNTNGRTIQVYLFDEANGRLSPLYASNSGFDRISFLIESQDRDDFFVVAYTSSIVFDLSYFNQRTNQSERYRATVTPSGSHCIKY